MAATVQGIFLSGDHASLPAASAPPVGSVYSCSDHDLVYQTDGSSWATWLTAGGGMTNPMTTQGDTMYGGASGAATRLGIGTAGQVWTVNAGATAPEWATPSTGGLTRTQVGTTAVGSSNENLTQTVLLKSVTLASDGYIANVVASLSSTGAGTVKSVRVGVYADSAGSPTSLIGYNYAPTGSFYPQSVAATPGAARWFAVPVGRWCAAGTYWLAIQSEGGTANLQIALETTGGSDKNYNPANNWMADVGTIYTLNSTSKVYSIYADVLT